MASYPNRQLPEQTATQTDIGSGDAVCAATRTLGEGFILASGINVTMALFTNLLTLTTELEQRSMLWHHYVFSMTMESSLNHLMSLTL